MLDAARKILIVEDEAFLLQSLAKRFTSEGFTVFPVKNGKDAYDTALREHPSAMLLDIILPDMDGLEMLRKLRRDVWGKTLVVIVLSNLKSAERVSEAMELGVTDFLVKADWKLEDIARKVQERLHLPA
jgi:DNA-binding response OmpR family regulator